jgi:hypothetical protein
MNGLHEEPAGKHTMQQHSSWNDVIISPYHPQPHFATNALPYTNNPVAANTLNPIGNDFPDLIALGILLPARITLASSASSIPYFCLCEMRYPPRPYYLLCQIIIRAGGAAAYQCADGQACDNRGDGAGAHVACDAADGGQGAEDEGWDFGGLRGGVLVE